jgi:hypothetical protein
LGRGILVCVFFLSFKIPSVPGLGLDSHFMLLGESIIRMYIRLIISPELDTTTTH